MIQCTFLLRVSLLSCHSPPSGQLSTVSVWHGFITEDILQQSWLEVFPPNTPLLSTYSHPSSAKPVHPFPVTSSNSWRNRSDLKSFHCKVFFQGYVVGYAFYNAIEKQDYFLLIPFLSSDYHLCSTTPPPPPKVVQTQHVKSYPFLLDYFSHRIVLWACSLWSQRNICTNVVQEVTQEQDSAIFGNDMILSARQHTTSSQISSPIRFTPHSLCSTGSYTGRMKKEVSLSNKE